MSAGLAGGPEAPARPLSQRLHEGTREAHERVEHTASFNRLVVVRLPATEGDAPAAERERLAVARGEYLEVYRRFLVASHGFEAAVNAALASSPALGDAIAAGWSSEAHDPAALVRADLAAVFGASAAATLPAMVPLAVPGTLAEFAGTEYVRRGSRAGGAVIAAVVEKNLGFHRARGASFLAQYGRDTRRVLMALRAWLDGLALDEGGARTAIAAAGETFEAVGRWHEQLEAAFERR